MNRLPRGGWPWLVPVAVGVLLSLAPLSRLDDGIGVLIGLIVVLLAARRPDRALIVLIVGLPFQTMALALLYKAGVPAMAVRGLSAWKEALVLGVVCAGIHGFHASGRRFDGLDWLAVLFIAIAGVYALAAPAILAAAPGAAEVRLLGFRQVAVFVILLLAARHARFPANFPERAARAVLAVSAIVALVAVYEFFFSSSWNRFVVQTVQLPRYQVEVLQVIPPNPFDYRIYGHIGDRQIIRAGSVFLSAASCGFFLLIGFSVAIERVLRRGARLSLILPLVLIGAAMIFTQTRSALIGAVVVAFLGFGAAAGRARAQRLRFALMLIGIALLALPAASATGLAQRTTGALTGADISATDHIRALGHGVTALVAHPLGQGLGTAAGTGQRFRAPTLVISENNYIHIGNELGIVAMAVFIALTLALIRATRRAARQRGEDLVAAVSGATVGLAIGALFLYPWNEFAVAWTVWGLAGAVLSLSRERARAGASIAGTAGPLRVAAVPAGPRPAPVAGAVHSPR